MITNSQSSSSTDITPVPETAYLTTHDIFDASVPNVIVHKLSGQNYVQWSQSVLMYVRGKGKENYVIGVAIVPSKEDPKFKEWSAWDNMVISWLINSMVVDIGESFMFYETAREIRDAVEETFSDKENT